MSDCAWASRSTAQRPQCRSTAVAVSVTVTVVPSASQRSNFVGGMCWSASAPAISGEMKADTPVQAMTHGTMSARPWARSMLLSGTNHIAIGTA